MADPYGFTPISNKMFCDDEPLWGAEPFTKWQALADILHTASWKDHRMVIKGDIFDVKRGQFLVSFRRLRKRWKWNSLGKVERFLKMLEKRGTIQVVKRTVNGTLYLLVNFDTYRNTRDSKRDANGMETGRARNTDGTLTGQEEDVKDVEDVQTTSRTDFDGHDDGPSDDVTELADELQAHGLNSRQAFECIRKAGGGDIHRGVPRAREIMALWEAARPDFDVGMLVNSLKVAKWIPNGHTKRPKTGEEIARERAKREWDSLPDGMEIVRKYELEMEELRREREAAKSGN